MKVKPETLRRRIIDLTEKFNFFVDRYYEIAPFSGPSVYFHRKVVDMIRNSKDYRELLLKNDLFMEYIYATLASWGMHRMDRKASLKDFDGYKGFKQSVRDNMDLLEELFRGKKLHELNDADKMKIKPILSDIFENLEVMKSGTKLIGNSKVLHHLLPDLIPPADESHTLNFFFEEKFKRNTTIYRKIRESEEKQKAIFLEIFDEFHQICKRVDHIENIYSERKEKENFTTSIPKLIDNAIIGYVKKIGRA